MRESYKVISESDYDGIICLIQEALIDLVQCEDGYHKSSAEWRLERALKMLFGEQEILD